MGLFRRGDKIDPAAKTVTAAAVPLAGPDRLQVGRTLATLAKPEDWQKESWYYFDAVGEYHSALTWISNLLSMAELFAAEVDPDTGEAGEATEDPRAIAIAQAVLGGPQQRPRLLKTLALQWQAVGESFIVVRPQPPKRGRPQPDMWMALSGSRVEWKAGNWSFLDPFTLRTVTLGPDDLMIRVWEGHPDDPVKANSAARSALPTLREIEKSSQYITAKLDSRLAGRGIWLVPQEMSFPVSEGLSKAESLMDYLLRAMAASLKNPGTSESQVPLVVEVPGELIPAASEGLIDFATAFDAAVVELRQDALRRLAAELDMPNETAEGSTGGMNHWGAWQVEESTWKIFGRPILDAIGDALTEHYYRPALAAAGVENPESFTLAWSVAEIVSRPDRTGELKDLWDDGLISDAYRLQEMGVPEDAIPDEEERERRELLAMVTASPALLSESGVAEALGYETLAGAMEDAAEQQRQAEETQREAEEERREERALPAAPDAGEPDPGLVAAASVVALRALERAGGKLLTREHRGQYADVPKWELHCHIKPQDPVALAVDCVTPEFLTAAAGDRVRAQDIADYVLLLLSNGWRHEPAILRKYLS